MNHSVSRADVARLAGVSKTTVSYVLNGKDMGISEETKSRVLAAARDLGYAPNRVAQALRTGKSNLIALWMPLPACSYSTHTLYHIHDNLRRAGYEVVLTDTSIIPEWSANVDSVSLWPVDGIIAVDSSPYVQEFLAHYGTAAPIVSMGASCHPKTSYVSFDLYPGVREAVRHLTHPERERIAFATLPSCANEDEERYKAYCEEIRAAKRTPEIISVPTRARADAYQAVIGHIRANGRPDAIFCYNDDIAIGIHRALLDLGIRMPEDIALIGHDGIEDTEYLEPRLSSVIIPIQKMCDMAWQMLSDLMSDRGSKIRQEVLPTYLKVRKSSE